MGVITIGIIGYLGYRSMYGRTPGSTELSTPKQRLDNVKGAAKRIENEQDKAAEQALEKAKTD